MALRLLSGPNVIRDNTGAALSAVDWSNGSTLWLPPWLPHRGAIVHGTAGSWSGFFIVTLDGVAEPIAQLRSTLSFGWKPANGALLTNQGSGVEYARDPYALAGFAEASDYAAGLVCYAKLADRRLYVDDTYHLAPDGGVLPWASGLTGGAAAIGPGRSVREVFIAQTGVASGHSGKAVFYDHVARTLSAALLAPGPFTWLAYAPELDVVVSIDTAGKTLSVWEPRPQAASIAAPVLYAGASQRGQVPSYRTQVLGADGEACPGELVDWSITGPGTLLDAQSATDYAGYATARVQLDFAGASSLQVGASLLC